jgi:hypothetical protein
MVKKKQAVATEWRVGDAGHTIFGPPNGTPTPEVIASVERREHAQLIVRAVNAHDALLAALKDERDALNIWVTAMKHGIPSDVLEGMYISLSKIETAIALAEGKE